ncbi:MAG: 5'-nucleotidase C-terminal domain-containing protein [Flavobacteriaceae bacterium]|nr:5'-nucleotidase C-terminal domain-containing protein [Flavobacteriaceae bacterium]
MLHYFKRISLIFCISLLVLSCKKEPYIITKITAKTIAIDTTIAAENSITKTIAPYKKQLLKEINTVLSYTSKNLVRTDGDLESSLGNLLADLSYQKANPIFKKMTQQNIDFALFNYGGIRAGINKGKVTNKHAFELMPFENRYVVVELSGEKIEELITYLIQENIAHPLSKQVQLTITKNGFELQINGQKFNRNKSYHVLTTDYLQSGGDRMNFFKNPLKKYNLDYKMRDAIVDYFKSVDTLQSKLDGRFKKN